MQIPDTENIQHQYAYKTGYRMAINGKSMAHMPSDVRHDIQMREFFQQGWEQAKEDLLVSIQQRKQPNWRYRIAWLAVMVIGGLLTGMHLIDRFETEKQQAQQKAIELASQNHSDHTQARDSLGNSKKLGLLNDNQRQDLKAIAPPQAIPLEPIIDSPIKVEQAVFSQQIIDRKPVEIVTDSVPKYIRELYFYTEISHAKDQSIYHRWRTETEILATIKLDINSDKFRTWSSKKLASGWQGQWYAEVLDTQKNVIARYPFYYGNNTGN